MENKSSQTATEVNTYSLWVHLPRHQGQQVCIRHGNGAICFLICRAETQKQRLITKTQTYISANKKMVIYWVAVKIWTVCLEHRTSRYIYMTTTVCAGLELQTAFPSIVEYLHNDMSLEVTAASRFNRNHQYRSPGSWCSHPCHCEHSRCRSSRPQTTSPPVHSGRPLLWRQTLPRSSSQTALLPAQSTHRFDIQ